MEEQLLPDLWTVVLRYLPPQQAYEMIMRDLTSVRKFLLVPETTYRARAGVLIFRCGHIFPSHSPSAAHMVGARQRYLHETQYARVNDLQPVYLPPNIILFPSSLSVRRQADSSIIVCRQYNSIIAGGIPVLTNLTGEESASIYDQLIDFGSYYY